LKDAETAIGELCTVVTRLQDRVEKTPASAEKSSPSSSHGKPRFEPVPVDISEPTRIRFRTTINSKFDCINNANRMEFVTILCQALKLDLKETLMHQDLEKVTGFYVLVADVGVDKGFETWHGRLQSSFRNNRSYYKLYGQ